MQSLPAFPMHKRFYGPYVIKIHFTHECVGLYQILRRYSQNYFLISLKSKQRELTSVSCPSPSCVHVEKGELKGSCATGMLSDCNSKNRPNIVLHDNTKHSKFIKIAAAKHAGCARAFKLGSGFQGVLKFPSKSTTRNLV